MKSLVKIALVAAVIVTAFNIVACGPSQKEIEERAKQAVLDSIARADSIRRADSTRNAEIVDSLKKVVEKEVKGEKKTKVEDDVPYETREFYASDDDDYAWLSQRRVTADDLAGLSSADLRILRNAIYARHGYIFKSADLRAYFSQFSWYTPISHDVQHSLSSLETKNVSYIKSWE